MLVCYPEGYRTGEAALLPWSTVAPPAHLPPNVDQPTKGTNTMPQQLPMFDDLHFWSSEDLAEYNRQCLGDINQLTAAYDADLIHPEEMAQYAEALDTLRAERAAVNSELAYRALVMQ